MVDWSLTKYVFSSTGLKYKYEVLVLKYSHFLLLPTYTPLHLRGKSCTFYSPTFAFSTLQITSENLVSPNVLICNVYDELRMKCSFVGRENSPPSYETLTF